VVSGNERAMPSGQLSWTLSWTTPLQHEHLGQLGACTLQNPQRFGSHLRDSDPGPTVYETADHPARPKEPLGFSPGPAQSHGLFHVSRGLEQAALRKGYRQGGARRGHGSGWRAWDGSIGPCAALPCMGLSPALLHRGFVLSSAGCLPSVGPWPNRSMAFLSWWSSGAVPCARLRRRGVRASYVGRLAFDVRSGGLSVPRRSLGSAATIRGCRRSAGLSLSLSCAVRSAGRVAARCLGWWRLRPRGWPSARSASGALSSCLLGRAGFRRRSRFGFRLA
jgi:hypothetical protein